MTIIPITFRKCQFEDKADTKTDALYSYSRNKTQSASRPGRFTLGKRALRNPLDRRLGGSQSPSGSREDENIVTR
jgi:hypothetical protein